MKAMSCNIIMKPLECGKFFTVVCMYVGASAGEMGG